ncbi:MAG: hypothetical protein EOR04_19600 [Mesorhizobium sp.]|uniref:hypothetical protein n=1 Tax=Mesorhizobium sp. TaxID=1871066 RepID=UPI000FE521D0|nr:hypothetical protein [Mesorhizobium sp.]RWP40153.1 MAG: hypothetical protein EOR04_19600 [Mesorhizobium sp.]
MRGHDADTVSRPCRHKETETETVTRDGEETGTETFTKKKTFTETVKIANKGVPSSSARGFGGKKGRKPSRAALYDLKASRKDCRSYEWPEPLFALRDWLRKHGVDVGALKSERQALWLAIRLGRQGKKMPHRLAPLFPDLLKVQRTLCPVKTALPRGGPSVPTKERGTFGPASPVRSVSIAAYLAEKAAAQDGGGHG